MTHCWPLQDAKARLSELVKKVHKNGPQYVSVHGRPSVVVISQDEYTKLTTPNISLIDFLRDSPLKGLNLSFPRDKSNNREVNF